MRKAIALTAAVSVIVAVVAGVLNLHPLLSLALGLVAGVGSMTYGLLKWGD